MLAPFACCFAAPPLVCLFEGSEPLPDEGAPPELLLAAPESDLPGFIFVPDGDEFDEFDLPFCDDAPDDEPA